MAVLPTPGSPIKTGLFLVRRAKICTMRSISSSRPMTGSSWPLAAKAVKSRVYSSKVGVLVCFLGSLAARGSKVGLSVSVQEN